MQNLRWQQSLATEDQPRLSADLGNKEIGALFFADGTNFCFMRGKWVHDAVLIGGLK